MDWVLLVVALGVILGGAELFTNGVEWIGEGYGLSEGAVGSVLAAVGTALPETILPLIAIVFGGAASGKEIGVGAIIGAPFMLSTLAMFVLGATVIGYARGGLRQRAIRTDAAVPKLDLSVFLVLYALSIVAGLIHVKAVNVVLAVCLMVAYGFYVRRHFAGPVGESSSDGLKPLHLARAPRPRRREGDAPTWLAVVQTLIGLGVIILGARIFVSSVTTIAGNLHVSELAFALLVAPVATELPETFNAGVIWARRGNKDTLAVGNITGALVFQSVFPVAIGLLLTPWHLTQDALIAALVAYAAAAFLLVQLLVRNRLTAPLLLLQGVLYGGYVAYVILARL
ncbi:MAG TPA: sodium:calcium antiporter [Actinomycetota bacterium]|nr:sodium:calcium antiporter [Actinomycetota bacterium]